MSEEPQRSIDEPDRREGWALARAVVGSSEDVEAQRAREAARAQLFGRSHRPKIGRYLIIELLGSGAMGSVYAAYDPKLDRKVALKVLGEAAAANHDGTTQPAEVRDSFVREARALAKVGHRNVVAVYDAGTFENRVFLTMELVEGANLRSWLAEEHPRPWREVLPVLIQAGRGLAAVHAAGLVHRDFKPDNVLVGADGVARVADFGLARTEQGALPEGLASGVTDGSPATIGAGTPAYFAPERRAGQAADAASDLFGFAVTVYEAIAGSRPFRPGSLELRALPDSLPQWLRRAVHRGLSLDPAKRQRSMDELLDELEAGLRGEARRRQMRRWGGRVLAGLALAGLSAGFFVSARDLQHRGRLAECDRAAAGIAEEWPERSEAVTAAIASSDLPYADATASRLDPHVQEWADAWRDARRQLCVDATVNESLAPELRPRAEGCLQVRKAELSQLLDLLEAGQPHAVQLAIVSVLELPPPEACVDARRLQQSRWPDDEQWPEVLELQLERGRALALAAAGDATEARAAAENVLEQARVIGWEPSIAEALLLLVRLDERDRDYDRAERHATEAFFAARRAGADELAAEAAASLVMIVGGRLARTDDGALWARHAEVALDALSAPDDRLRVLLLDATASMKEHAGQLDEAGELFERAVALTEELEGVDHPHVAGALTGLANLRQLMGQFDVAQPLLQRALDLYEAALGPDHPDVAVSLNNLAVPLLETGRYEEARPLLERGIAILEGAFGPDHPRLSSQLFNLANVEDLTGHPERARGMFERTLAIRERVYGPDHPEVAAVVAALAQMHFDVMDVQAATEGWERALAILERAHGPDHPTVGALVNNLGMARAAAGDVAEARRLYERALAIGERHFGPDHRMLASTRCNLAAAYAQEGDAAGSLPHFERCVAAFDSMPGDPPGAIKARFRLAAALIDADGDRERARGLARRALDDLRRIGGPEEDIAEVTAFIERYGASSPRSD